MVDYLYVDLDTGNLKAAAKGSLGSTPGRWHPVIWVDTLGDTHDRVMSTMQGLRSWVQHSQSNPVPHSAIIASDTEIILMDNESVLDDWKRMLSQEVDPAPFPYVHTIDMGPSVLNMSYDISQAHPVQPEDLWVKIEHNPANPGTIQLPGGISCAPSDADPSQKQKPAQTAAPSPGQQPGGGGNQRGGGGGGGTGGSPVPGPGGGGAPSAPAPFPGPAGAGGSNGENGSGGNGGDEPSDSQSQGGAWGIWYGGDE